MKYIGKGSVASFLRMTLSFVWWMGIVMIGLFAIFTVFVSIFGVPKGIEPPHHLTFKTDFGEIYFTDAIIKNPKQLFFAFIPFGALMLGLGMTIIYQLRKIFATLAVGNPFVIQNAKRIRIIGLIILGGAFVKLFADLAMGYVLMKNLIVKGVTFSAKADLNVGAIFVSLVILIIAEIFHQGALLKDEHDLTI